MRIHGGQVFIGKHFQNTDIEFNDKITGIGENLPEAGEVIDAADCYVVPGFVDIHTHGAMGEDFSDGEKEGIGTMMKYYASKGVTSVLATTMTLKEPEIIRAVTAIKEYGQGVGARIAGIHLEGPFLSSAKKGAQNADNLHKPDADMWHRINDASGNMVKMVTVAPEEEGAMEFINEVSKYCTVSIGHTTADYETAMKAFGAGATHATHLYNGMPGLHHRQPGVIGAACDAGASVELICDGLHIHPSVIRLTGRLFGDKLNLISDSLRCAGMPDGDYMLGGQPIEMKNGKATLKDSDTLAGSSISILDALKRVTSFGMDLEKAVYASSTAPALAVKLDDAGSLTIGKRADILILDSNLNIKNVFIGGKLFS